MATIEEVRHNAGRLMGIVQYPHALRSEDDALLTEAYAQVYDTLKDENLNDWPEAGPVPDRYVPHLAALMAFNKCDEKGVAGERYNRILSRRNVAMPEIRRMVAPVYESVEEPTSY